MKIFKSILSGVMALTLLGGFASCQDDIDAPEPTVPVAANKANTTIFDLKKEFWDDATNYIKEIGTKPDGSHYIVAGRVITSDEGGNIFKSITIQDETAALTFSVNTYNLFLNYRIGQELVVDLTGMYIGKYNGLQQIGWPEFYEQGNAWEATFMAPQFFYSHVEPNGLPDASKVIIHELSSISDIPAGTAGLIAWQSQVVRCNNIKFVPKVDTNTGELVTNFGVYKTNMNQGVELAGQEVTMRVSGYADFVNDPMPTDACDAKFFLSYYGTGWQLMLMSTDDIYNIGNPSLPVGTEDNPYSVTRAIEAIDGGETPAGWISGYIVGTVAMEVTNVTSNDDIDWGTDAMLASTVVIADEADCRDFSKCFIVPLPTGSVMREYVAILNHPENVGKQLKVLGTLDHYLGTYGLTGNNGTAAEFRLEGVEVPGGQPTEGNGTKEAPYSCEKIIALNPQSTTDAVESGVWVKGYLVGYYNNNTKQCMFQSAGALGANILLSTNPQASTKEECICIQLVNGTQPRINLNLIDNPGLLGAEIMVQGDVMKYNTFPGIKNTSDYSILSQPVGPDQPDVPTGGDGTEASPYAVGSIIAMAPSSTTEAVKEDVWAEGYLVGYYKDYAAHFTAEGAQAANILLAATATASTKEECICIQLVNGSDVRKALNLIDNPGNLGKKVSVRGDVMKYNSLPGIKNTDAYKIDGQGGGDQPDTPTGDAIFEETFEGGTLGNFTATVETSGSWTGWRANTRTPLCAIANSYVNSANEAATAWLISPEISLNGVSNATLSFEHAFGFYFPTSQDAFCTVYVREKGGSWNQLTLTNFPAKGTGNWTSFAANTFSLSAYAGKTIEVGFKYMNDGKQSVAWEIKNFKVTK